MNRLSSTHARSGPIASTLNFLMTLFLCAMALPFVVTVAVIGFPFLVILGSLLGGPLVIFFLVRYLAFEIKVPVLYHGMTTMGNPSKSFPCVSATKTYIKTIFQPHQKKTNKK